LACRPTARSITTATRYGTTFTAISVAVTSRHVRSEGLGGSGGGAAGVGGSADGAACAGDAAGSTSGGRAAASEAATGGTPLAAALSAVSVAGKGASVHEATPNTAASSSWCATKRQTGLIFAG